MSTLVATGWLESPGDSPLEVVFDSAVDTLCELVELGECNSSKEQLRQRRSLVNLISNFSILCKTLHMRASKWLVLPPLLFYERTRLGITSSGYFLEGCPAGLPLFSGSCNITVPDDQVVALRLRDVLADRMTTIGKLEKMSKDSTRQQRVFNEHPVDDLPLKTPSVVRVFVSRMRSICRGLARVKAANDMQQCQNCNCNRLFYKGQGGELVAARVHPKTKTTLLPDEPNSDDESGDYWFAMDMQRDQGGPYNRRFCTSRCRHEWHQQLRECLPLGKLDADERCRKKGRARVNEALRQCMKRNEEASRALRGLMKETRSFPALSEETITKQRTRRVRRLNVDLGLLYAAACLAESSQLSKNRILPGMISGWRLNRLFYAKPVRETLHLYRRLKLNDSLIIISTDTHKPTFLEKMKRGASNIF